MGTIVGIIGACAIVGVTTWEDADEITLCESKSISLQKKNVENLSNFLFTKPVIRIIIEYFQERLAGYRYPGHNHPP